MIANVQELITDTVREKTVCEVCSINQKLKTHCLTNIVAYKCIELFLNIYRSCMIRKKKVYYPLYFQSNYEEREKWSTCHPSCTTLLLIHTYRFVLFVNLYTAKKVWWISLKTAYYITQNQDLE